MGPRVFGLAVVQLNFYVNIRFASAMVDGSVVAIRYAFMLCFFVLGMIGQSQASAVFPTLAALRAQGDYDGFKDRLARAMRNVLYLAFPASALAHHMLGEPLVGLLAARRLERRQHASRGLGAELLRHWHRRFCPARSPVARFLRAGGHLDAGRRRQYSPCSAISCST